jgi:hypothetical protein
MSRRELPKVNAYGAARVAGLADRTQSTQLSGLSWYGDYAKTHDEPTLNEITVEYVAADNGRELILRYMLWLAKEKLQTKHSKKREKVRGLP